MSYLLRALLFGCFVATFANVSGKPTESGNDVKKAQPNVIYNYYAGPNCKKLEQQVAEILKEIRAKKRNETGGGLNFFLINLALHCNLLY